MVLNYKTYRADELTKAHILGKTAKSENALLLPWSYGGLEFCFNGRNVIFEFGDYSDGAIAYVRVDTDGVSVKYAVGRGGERVITLPLAEGRHTVSLMRLTEGMEALKLVSVTVAGEDPAMTGAPAQDRIKLMFIGDSITCGYGVDAPSVSPFNTFEEDCTLTYAYMAARETGGEILFTGASGKGIVANCEGNRADMTLRQAFAWETRRGGEWDPAGYEPDLVIINAGTNDAWGGVTDEEFYPAATAFMGEIRAAFPHAPILWAYGIMDTTKIPCIKKAVEAFDALHGNAYFLDCGCMSSFPGETGGGGHPNVNTSLRVYPVLAAKIREILNK